MALARRPAMPAPKSEAEIEALISKGGTPPANSRSRRDNGERDEIPLKLRVPPKLLRHIDEPVLRRAVRIPRHSWLIEALVEKVERDAKRR